MRPFFAFLISPLPVVALLLLIGVRLTGNRDPVQAAIAFYTMLFVFQLIFAVPLRWLLARRRQQSLWVDSVVGGLACLLPVIGYFVLWPRRERLLILAAVVVGFTLQGAMIGVTYGLLRLRDRRARQAATPAELADRFS